MGYFVKGLKPTIKKIVWGGEPEDLDEAYQKARTRELYLISKKGKLDVTAEETGKLDENIMKPAARNTDDMKELLKSMNLMMQNQQKPISLQQETLKLANSQKSPAIRGRYPKTPNQTFRSCVVCWNCKKTEHFQNHFPEPHKEKNIMPQQN